MTVGCITFDELESRANEARRARWETQWVVSQSEAYRRVDFGLLVQAAFQTFVLKFKLRILAFRQQALINKLVETDFLLFPKEKVREITSLIDDLVRYEREVLENSQKLGMVTRFLWKPSLTRLRDQTEHLDSISESLHIALDDKTTALMAMALEEFNEVSYSLSSQRVHFVKM
jgi:hypothetical protein